jgi:hypothetical protein
MGLMTFILLLILAAFIAEGALWLVIKHFRVVPDETSPIRSSLFRETLWWLLGTLVVLILLGLLAERVYKHDETQASRIVVNPQTASFNVCGARLCCSGLAMSEAEI